MIKKIAIVIRKILLIFASELIGNPVGYSLIGLANRLSGGRLATIFLVYPPHEGYIEAVTFPRYAARADWHARFAGIYSPAPGQLGLVLAVTSLEAELIDPANTPRLQALLDSLEAIRKLTAAGAIALAGVLPSTMRNRNLRRSVREREQTAAIVEQAIYSILADTGLGDEAPVILLGGAGYIGNQVHTLLRQNSVNPLVVVDPQDGDQPGQKLGLHRGRQALLVNVARNGALEQLQHMLWPELVILNEVFPEASRETRRTLSQRGIAYFHLAGIRGFALPRFARAYSNAIPCCALALKDAEQARDRLIIKRL